MASVAERVAVFEDDFLAAQQLYERVGDSAQSREKLSQLIRNINKVALEASLRTDPDLGEFDPWIAMRCLSYQSNDPDRTPTSDKRKELLGQTLIAVDQVSERLNNGSSHVAVLEEQGGVSIYKANGSSDLVKLNKGPIGHEGSHNNWIETEPPEEGIYVRFSEGKYARSYLREDSVTPSQFIIRDAEVYLRGVLVERKESARTPGFTWFQPVKINSEFEPNSDKALPFIPLGNQEAPIDTELLESFIKTDKQRFAFRAAAYAGGIASWLSVEYPGKKFQNVVVSDLASVAAKLLKNGTEYDSTSRAPFRSRGRVYKPERTIADYSLSEIKAIIHGAGIRMDDIKKKTLKNIGSEATTMREIAGQLSARRAVNEFFDCF